MTRETLVNLLGVLLVLGIVAVTVAGAAHELIN